MSTAVAPLARELAERARNDSEFAWVLDAILSAPTAPQILESLTRFTGDAVTADRIMRLTHDELGGASIAEALRHPQTAETAWRMLTALDA